MIFPFVFYSCRKHSDDLTLGVVCSSSPREAAAFISETKFLSQPFFHMYISIFRFCCYMASCCSTLYQFIQVFTILGFLPISQLKQNNIIIYHYSLLNLALSHPPPPPPTPYTLNWTLSLSFSNWEDFLLDSFCCKNQLVPKITCVMNLYKDLQQIYK